MQSFIVSFKLKGDVRIDQVSMKGTDYTEIVWNPCITYPLVVTNTNFSSMIYASLHACQSLLKRQKDTGFNRLFFL